MVGMSTSRFPQLSSKFTCLSNDILQWKKFTPCGRNVLLAHSCNGNGYPAVPLIELCGLEQIMGFDLRMREL